MEIQHTREEGGTVYKAEGTEEEEHIGRNQPGNEEAPARLVLGTSRH